MFLWHNKLKSLKVAKLKDEDGCEGDDDDGDEGVMNVVMKMVTKVQWLILRGWGVLVTYIQTNKRMDIGDCRVASATENRDQCPSKFVMSHCSMLHFESPAAPILFLISISLHSI